MRLVGREEKPTGGRGLTHHDHDGGLMMVTGTDQRIWPQHRIVSFDTFHPFGGIVIDGT